MRAPAPALERPPVPPAWMGARLAPTGSVRRLDVGRRAVLFCERRQQLFELDPAATEAWDALAGGGSVERLASASGADPELCAGMARQWLEDGWLAPADLAERLAAPADRILCLELAGIRASLELRLEGDAALDRELAEVFAPFAAPAGAGQARLDVVAWAGAWFVLRDGLSLGMLPRERVTPEVKAQLTDALCRQRAEGGLFLHAALLASGAGGLLISGAPGAGKTTLALALAARGLGYGSDDLVKVSADGRLTGVRFSPAVKSGAWELLAPYAPELADQPARLRADGQRVRYLPADGLAPCRADGARWILLLDRREAAPAELVPVDPLDAMTALLGSAFAPDHRLRGETLAALAARFSDAASFRLTYSDLAQAVAVVEGLVGG